MNHIQTSNRDQRRAAAKYLSQENAKWPDTLQEWPRAEWPATASTDAIRVFRSRGFLVQEFHAKAPAIVRLSINRAAINSSGGWQQDITWEELQRLKREAGYGDHDAVEIFPADADVVNVANMRHLWIVAGGSMPFVWRKS